MQDLDSIFAVAAILWTVFIAYAIYLDLKLRKLEEKLGK